MGFLGGDSFAEENEFARNIKGMQTEYLGVIDPLKEQLTGLKTQYDAASGTERSKLHEQIGSLTRQVRDAQSTYYSQADSKLGGRETAENWMNDIKGGGGGVDKFLAAQGLDKSFDFGTPEYTTAMGEMRAAGDLEKNIQRGIEGSKEQLGQALGAIGEGATAATETLTSGAAAMKDIYKTGTEQAQGQLQPYKDAGTKALDRQQNLMGLGTMSSADVMKELEGTPGYQFNLQQGLGAISAGAAARGGTFGGRALKELQTRGAGIASGTYNTTIGQLGQMASRGQQAATTMAGIGMQGTAGMANAEQFGASSVANVEMGEASAVASVYGQQASTTANMYGQQATTGTNITMQSTSQQAQSQWQRMEAQLAREMAEWQSGQAMFGDIMSVVGTVGGAAIGGPVGAAIGAKIGPAVGRNV